MNTPLSHTIDLAFPVPVEDEKSISSLTMRRPTSRDIADFMVIIGGERIAVMIKEVLDTSDGETVTADDLKNTKLVGELVDNLAGLVSAEVLDEFFGLLSRMLAIDPHQAEELAPEDMVKVYGALQLFFPNVFSQKEQDGEKS